jgi:hypothetical protein
LGDKHPECLPPFGTLNEALVHLTCVSKSEFEGVMGDISNFRETENSTTVQVYEFHIYE